MSYSGTTATLIVALLLAGITRLFFKRNAQTTSYAPGPKPKPLIGNLLDIPSRHAARVFAQWGKTYNSTYSKLQFFFGKASKARL